MHRAPRLLLVAAIGHLAGNASANYTIDLIWADTGTATLTVSPGDSAAPVGSSGACAGGQGRWLRGLVERKREHH